MGMVKVYTRLSAYMSKTQFSVQGCTNSKAHTHTRTYTFPCPEATWNMPSTPHSMSPIVGEWERGHSTSPTISRCYGQNSVNFYKADLTTKGHIKGTHQRDTSKGHTPLLILVGAMRNVIVPSWLCDLSFIHDLI